MKPPDTLLGWSMTEPITPVPSAARCMFSHRESMDTLRECVHFVQEISQPL
jgi:hypothetical protein